MKTTPEQAAKLRELYRKNYLALISLAPELVAGKVPEQPPKAGDGNEAPLSDVPRTSLD